MSSNTMRRRSRASFARTCRITSKSPPTSAMCSISGYRAQPFAHGLPRRPARSRGSHTRWRGAPRSTGSVRTEYPVMTPASVSRLIRAWAPAREMCTASAIAVIDARASRRSSSRIARIRLVQSDHATPFLSAVFLTLRSRMPHSSHIHPGFFKRSWMTVAPRASCLTEFGKEGERMLYTDLLPRDTAVQLIDQSGAPVVDDRYALPDTDTPPSRLPRARRGPTHQRSGRSPGAPGAPRRLLPVVARPGGLPGRRRDGSRLHRLAVPDLSRLGRRDRSRGRARRRHGPPQGRLALGVRRARASRRPAGHAASPRSCCTRSASPRPRSIGARTPWCSPSAATVRPARATSTRR